MRGMKNVAIVLLLLSCGACKKIFDFSPSEKFAAISDSIRTIILDNEFDADFNGSILVGLGTDILLRQHYGFVDIEKSASINNRSKFNVGSGAKEIPAMALIVLIEEGRISCGDTINKFLTSLPLWAGKITVENLLFYESGLPHMNFLTSSSDESTFRDLAKIDTLLFDPGTRYLYSNFNNFLQAKIVEHVVGSDFRSWVKSNFFQPLEMSGAVYTSNPTNIALEMTKSWSGEFGDDEDSNPDFKQFELCYGPLYMTTLDMFKWMVFVQNKYIKRGSRTECFYRLSSLSSLGPLGIIEKQNGEIVLHEHGGMAYSFEILMYRDYEKGTTIILMSNRSKRKQLSSIKDEIIRIIDMNMIQVNERVDVN